MKSLWIKTLIILSIMFNLNQSLISTKIFAEAVQENLCQGTYTQLGKSYSEWEDASLKAKNEVYDTEGGYENTIILAGGTGTAKTSSRTRAVIRVGLSCIQNSIIAQDATLTYHVSTAPTVGGRVNLYKIVQTDGDWKSAEYSSMGEQAAGYACSAFKKRDSFSLGGTLDYYPSRTNDGTSWTGGFQLGDAGGGSYEQLPIAFCDFTAGSTALQFTIPKETVQEWANGINTGLVMRLDNETSGSISLYSANNTSDALRPSLNVSYIPSEFKLLSLDIKDSMGNNITSIYKGLNGISVTAQFENKLGYDTPISLIVGIYDGETEGLLKAVKCVKTEQPVQNNYSSTLTALLSRDVLIQQGITNGDYMKIFFWDGFSKTVALKNLEKFSEPLFMNNVKDFAAVNGINTNMNDVGLEWCRHDFSWELAEPTKGQFNEAQITTWGNMITEAKQNGITVLPILDYTASWAANPAAYSCFDDSTGILYELSEATSDWHRTIKQTNSQGVVKITENVACNRSVEPFADVNDWKRYVTKIVETYSAEPYNLKYFQIWNEAHPRSGFFNGDMDWYIENIHKPAAEIIRSYGGKVVYGGLPSVYTGVLAEFYSLLDRTQAWSTIDVFDCHYFSLNDLEDLYNQAIKRGINSPCVWQTEMGYSANTLFIPTNYPQMYYWALGHRSDQSNQFKQFYYTYWSPNDPVAYGYGKTLYSGDTLSGHGKAMKTFMNILDGNNTERYTAVSSNKVSESAMKAFQIDNKKAAVSVNVSDLSQIQSSNFSFKGIFGTQNVKLIDAYGDTTYDLAWQDNGKGNIVIQVPSWYTYSSFYILIEADMVIAPTNNIKDFEYGTRATNNSSFIAAGRWSYLDDYYDPLKKGNSNGVFSTNEWTCDNLKPEHAWCLDSSGNIYTDTRPVAYNYTINKPQEGTDLTVSGTFAPNYYTKSFEIWKTSDSDEYSVGNDKVLLYSYTGNNTQSFSVTIPAADVELGNDILFVSSSPNGANWFIPAKLNATIEVTNYLSNNVTDYNSTVNQITGDRWSYLTSNITFGSTVLSPGLGLCVKNNSTANNNWYLGGDRIDNWVMYPNGGMQTESGRFLISNYTIGEKTAGKELKISGTFTGEGSADLYILKTKDTVTMPTGSGTDSIIFEDDYLENIVAHYSALPSNGGEFEVTIPAEEAIAGNDILFWSDVKNLGYLTNSLNATIECQINAKEQAKDNSIISNSITNFAADENRTDIGRWSYYASPTYNTVYDKGIYLMKGNGGYFAEDEYAADINNINHVWFVKSNGNWCSDTRSLAWVYTLDSKLENSSGGVKIRGKAAAGEMRLIIFRTSDMNAKTVGTDVTVLYDQTLTSHSFDINIPSGICKEGNDIIIMIQKTSGNEWWVPGLANFTVKGI